MRQNFVDVKLFTACQSTDFLHNFCPTTLQPANWTLKIDATVLYFDGTIANHKEIGLGHLLASWLQDDVFTLPSCSDGVTPGPSRGHTLMGLDCVHWILQQNLRIQSQSPEQKLCHKARRFYVMATSRPFTYLEPSITARSSGASFDLYVQICVPISSS